MHLHENVSQSALRSCYGVPGKRRTYGSPSGRGITTANWVCKYYTKNKQKIFIGCWNVRTLVDVGSQAVTMRTLYDYRVSIACLSEVRLPGSGSKCIKVPGVDTSYWLYHGGLEDNSGQHGVGLALSSDSHNALLSGTPLSRRTTSVRFG